MIDADIIVATRSSAFDRLTPSGRDLDPDDLDRLAVSLDHLVFCCCESGGDESGKHLPLEAMAEYEQLLVDAVSIAGEQL
jgi:hypothetical protein